MKTTLEHFYYSEFVEDGLSIAQIADEYVDEPREVRASLEKYALDKVRKNQAGWCFRYGTKVAPAVGLIFWCAFNYVLQFSLCPPGGVPILARLLILVISSLLCIGVPILLSLAASSDGELLMTRAKSKIVDAKEEELHLILKDLNNGVGSQWIEIAYDMRLRSIQKASAPKYIEIDGQKVPIHVLGEVADRGLLSEVVSIYGKPVSREGIETMEDWYKGLTMTELLVSAHRNTKSQSKTHTNSMGPQ